MQRSGHALLLCLAILLFPSSGWAEDQKPDAKSISEMIAEVPEAEAIKKLQSRGANPIGNFRAFASLLYAMEGIVISTGDKNVAQAPLRAYFPDGFYKPSWAQVLESMARETGTSVKYIKGVWSFNPPAMPRPYELTMAEGWRSFDRGLEVDYKPSIAPVGMDVYMMGRYPNEDAATTEKIVAANAMLFAKMLSKDAKESEMKKEKIADLDVLFYETRKNKANCIWRQWSFMKDKQAFVIVSAIDPENDEKLWPQVKAMVDSFKVLPPTPFPGL